ncbi:hypothetical protein HM1_3089 [Heliomicrobium modesticaldum Ice1]|uniref:Uncharacterized protein n=1 Tax=Heliobacterium modesticaldum (strain ATCC 51547 / Ice1) TaxID=498761 RepID=B0TEA8_HELMI|nr:hypothetical protein HM1_3089 [Heliomicrobium modesticaldum Ice1]
MLSDRITKNTFWKKLMLAFACPLCHNIKRRRCKAVKNRKAKRNQSDSFVAWTVLENQTVANQQRAKPINSAVVCGQASLF